MPNSLPFNLPDYTIAYDKFYSVEEIFEDLFIAHKLNAQEFASFMLARRLFHRECQVLLAAVWARGGEAVIETIQARQVGD